MPQRPFSRDQVFLIPPVLDDWVPPDHPVRFVAELIDSVDAARKRELGIDGEPAAKGEKRYALEALLAIWVYGFMSRMRSSRELEAACRDQVPFRWLSGNQTPDHNTLARFYRQHQQALRGIFALTVEVAVESGLVDWALQAVDATKIIANASGRKTLTASQLALLRDEVDGAIAALEDAQTANDRGPTELPDGMRTLRERRQRIDAALAIVVQRRGPTQANVTDPDATLMPVGVKKTVMPAYNAQATVCALAGDGTEPTGRLIVGALVRTKPDDRQMLIPMIDEATRLTGYQAEITTADGGYYSGRTLQQAAARGATVVIPERRTVDTDPYHLSRFDYLPDQDAYRCARGQTLRFGGTTHDRLGDPVRRYRADPATCRACPLMGECTTNHRHGRTLAVSVHAPISLAHRQWMTTEPAQAARQRRGPLIEGVFGILKEPMGARRFLHRGLEAVTTEWQLLAAAHNLRTLWRRKAGQYPGLVAGSA